MTGCMFRMAFEFLKNPNSVQKYGAIIGRVVLALLRYVDEENGPEQWLPLDKVVNNIEMDDMEGDAEDEQEMDNHHEDILALAEEFEDDIEQDFKFEEESEDESDNDDLYREEMDDDDLDQEEMGGELEDDLTSSYKGNMPDYPIALTEDQRMSLTMLRDGLKQNLSQNDLLELFHQVSLSLFSSQPEDSERLRFHQPIEYFILAFNLRKDGGFRKTIAISGSLSILQYWAQLTALRDAVFSPEDTAEYVIANTLL